MIRRVSIEVLERIRERLETLYGEGVAKRCLERLSMMVGRYGIGIYERDGYGYWDQGESLLITYADSVCRDSERTLRCLRRFLNDHLRGAVSTVHLLPFFPYSSDDGFSVIDYREVRPEIGSWSDVEALGKDFSLAFDLVLNHVSRKSAWFNDFVNGVQPARHFFLDVDPNLDLSAVVRPRSTPLLTRTKTRDGECFLWATFSDDQIDLNFANPDVLFEFLDILMFYISKGARVIRLDAIAYLWKQIGTTCIHLPQTHEVVKLMRDFLRMVAPEVLILSETNVPHEENVSYFGEGDEAHVVYQFSLPPLLLHALTTGNATYLTKWAASLKPPPPGCTFLNFTASHDGVGVRPLEGVLSDDELTRLIKHVERCGGHVSSKRNEDGSESPYELNISYFDAMGSDRDDTSDEKIARFLLSQTIPLALRGIPAVYIHSLTATPNDYDGVEESGRARSINRMQWDETVLRERLKDESSPTHRIFHELVRRLRLCSGIRPFHPEAPQRVLDFGKSFFAVERTSLDGCESLVSISNVTAKPASISAPKCKTIFDGSVEAFDLLRDRTRVDLSSPLTLAPYQAVWLAAQKDQCEVKGP